MATGRLHCNISIEEIPSFPISSETRLSMMIYVCQNYEQHGYRCKSKVVYCVLMWSYSMPNQKDNSEQNNYWHETNVM